MSHDFELERTALFALGALTEFDAAEAEAHLAECELCKTEFAKLRAASNTLGLTVEAGGEHDLRIARTKKRLMSALPARRRLSERSYSVDTWYRAVAVASVALAVVASGWAISLQRHLIDARVALAEQMHETRNAAYSAATARTELAVLLAPETKRFDVAAGTVLRYDGHVYLALNRLPALQAHRAFQAWTIAPGSTTVQPSVTFVPGNRGTTFIALPQREETVHAVAVSIEPDGGSKTPTTKPIFYRELI